MGYDLVYSSCFLQNHNSQYGNAYEQYQKLKNISSDALKEWKIKTESMIDSRVMNQIKYPLKMQTNWPWADM